MSQIVHMLLGHVDGDQVHPLIVPLATARFFLRNGKTYYASASDWTCEIAESFDQVMAALANRHPCATLIVVDDLELKEPDA